MLYIINLLFGALWLRGSMDLIDIGQKNPFNLPLTVQKHPILYKIASPSFVLAIQAINGYLITKSFLHIILLPILTFVVQFIMVIIIRELPKRTQYSMILNPVIHNVIFSILLICSAILNLIRLIA